jgi:hypothetical protein
VEHGSCSGKCDGPRLVPQGGRRQVARPGVSFETSLDDRVRSHLDKASADQVFSSVGRVPGHML